MKPARVRTRLRGRLPGISSAAMAFLCAVGAGDGAHAAGAAPAGPPGCDAERFVRQVHRDLLGREPQRAVLTELVRQLSAGTPRARIALAILKSPEHRRAQVRILFAALLGRAPEPAALEAMAGILHQGGSVEQVQAIILGSQEYYLRRGGGTAEGYLRALYRDVLDRPVDDAARTQWARLLAAGSRDAVAAAVATGPEAASHRAWLLYGPVLRQAPAGAIPAAAGGPMLEQAIASLLGSDAYCSRVGQARAIQAAPAPKASALAATPSP